MGSLDAESSRYGSIIIDPVTLWCGDMTLDIAPEDQFVLSVYMYQVLRQHLGHDFTIVDQPGPGVMRLRIAVIDFGRASTGMHTVSATPPPARSLNDVKKLSAGAYSFTGAAESEGEVTDSVTGSRLLAWVDGRPLFTGGRVTTVDEPALRVEARERAADIVRRAGLDRASIPVTSTLYD